MNDSYFNYDPSFGNLASPQLFNNKSFQDYSDQAQYPSEANGQDQLIHYPQDSESQEQPENRNLETMSNYSASSTNCSKTSHDQKNTRVIPIINKKIHKYYEPLIDGNTVYRYEDDPEEYKKARKRIQNRESASRVRSRKKNYIGDLEVDFEVCKKENEELKVKNASLTAENNLLRQQIQFLEKMVMKSTGSPQHMDPEPILPVTINPEPKKPSINIFRAAPAQTYKKHVGILSIVTIMICISYGVVAHTPISGGSLIYDHTFKNNMAYAIKSINTEAHGIDKDELHRSMSQVWDQIETFNSVKSVIKWTVIAGYFMYVGFILSITNWRNIFNSKKKQL